MSSTPFDFGDGRFGIDYFGPNVSPAPRVCAVTSGWYNNCFRTQGDIFDLLSIADFSDSTVNYQANGGESGFGWMVIVPSTTPLFDWLSSQTAPYLPPQDPLRRTVY